MPFGVTLGPDGTIYTTEDYYHIIRKVTGANIQGPPPSPPVGAPTIVNITTNFGQVVLSWTAVNAATNYNVKRSTSSGSEITIASTPTTSYTDTNVVSGVTYYYVVSAVNTGGEGPNSAEVSVTVPIPLPPSPTIGWFDYEGTNPAVTVFYPVSGTPHIANNDLTLAITNTTGFASYYTDNGTAPGSTNGGTPPTYQNGTSAYVQPLSVNSAADLTIKAVNVNAGGSSAIVSAEFIFQTATPNINGNNAAQFAIGDITSGAQFLYTTDGSDPRTNVNATLIGPISGTNSSIALSVSFPANANSMLFQIVGFKANYETSSVASEVFSISNFMANTMSFGFASGEASSDFVGTPGQTFYAPVTLTTLPSTKIYSLQFNVTVTNAGPNPGPVIGGPPAPFWFFIHVARAAAARHEFPLGRSIIHADSANDVCQRVRFHEFGVHQPLREFARCGLGGTLHQDQPLQHDVPGPDSILAGA